MICDQEAQEKVTSALETAETVVQSHEDVIQEQCDVEELQEEANKVMKCIDSNFKKEVEWVASAIVQNEANLNVRYSKNFTFNHYFQNVITNFIKESDANRTDSNNKIFEIIEMLLASGERCKITSELVTEQTGDIYLRLVSCDIMY